MYRLTRKAEGGVARIMIDNPPADGSSAGLGLGGSYYFEPEIPQEVSAYAAGVIMGDPGMAPLFTCDPPFQAPGSSEPAPAEPPAEKVAAPAPEPFTVSDAPASSSRPGRK